MASFHHKFNALAILVSFYGFISELAFAFKVDWPVLHLERLDKILHAVTCSNVLLLSQNVFYSHVAQSQNLDSCLVKTFLVVRLFYPFVNETIIENDFIEGQYINNKILTNYNFEKEEVITRIRPYAPWNFDHKNEQIKPKLVTCMFSILLHSSPLISFAGNDENF